jgi:hypothetical protein
MQELTGSSGITRVPEGLGGGLNMGPYNGSDNVLKLGAAAPTRLARPGPEERPMSGLG